MRWLLVVCAVAACGRYRFDELSDGGGDANDLATAGHVIGISVGASHTCAVHETGRVSCWGENDHGELGDGTSFPHGIPALVTGLTDAVEVAAGLTHTCARRATGQVACWGSNDNGRLGHGSVAPSSVPVDVLFITDAVQLVVGLEHACARRATGQIFCWGRGDSGELGDGAMTDSSAPVLVATIADATDIAAGGYFTCAVRAGGIVNCWGYGFEGTMGNGTFTTNNPLPVLVQNVSNIVDVETGVWFACARSMTGAVSCWGANFNGELGLGITATHRTTPVALSITDAKQLAASGISTHACAQHASGTWACWGYGSYGPLGDGRGITSNAPVETSVTDTELRVGGWTTCGRTDGTVRCWGLGSTGQSGDGLTFVHETPVVIDWLAGAVQLAPADVHMCAIDAGGSVRCAGVGEHRRLGNGSDSPSMTPVSVIGGAADFVAASSSHTCFLSGGAGSCWGENYYGQLGDDTTNITGSDPVPVTGLSGLAEIHPGDGFTCSRDTTNRVSCWASNLNGELGDGTMTSRTSKAVATGVTDALVLATNAGTSCIYRTNGTNACWGNNSNGLIGDGTTMNRSLATMLGAAATFDSLAISATHVCGASNGRVVCWGENDHGQLGGGSTTSTLALVQLPGVTDATGIAVNYGASCAIRTGGTVWCWGAGGLGQLGNGTRTDSLVPVQVIGVTGAVEIGMAADYACARTPTQTFCWGFNETGQFGDGTESIRVTPGPSVIGLP